MTIFYKIDNRYLGKVANVSHDQFFPTSIPIHKISCCDHKHLDECSHLRELFGPLFKETKEFIDWGAIGIITYQSDEDPRFYEYKWYLWICNDDIEQELNNFSTQIQTSPGNYLLLGENAELLFESSDADNKESLPCLAITGSKETVPQHSWLKAHGWNECQKENPFCDIEDVDKRQAWNNYISAVSGAVQGNPPEGSILYAPVLTYKDRQLVLAGGLIWCVKPTKLSGALEHVHEAQLFLRWIFSEILKLFPNLGMSANRIDRFADTILRCREMDWFNGNDKPIPHDYEKADSTVIKAIRHRIGVDLGISDKIVFDGTKSLVLSNSQNKKYWTPIEYLLKLISELTPTNQLSDKQEIYLSAFLKKDRDGIIFLKAFLKFLEGLPKSGQRWEVSQSESGNINFIDFKLPGLNFGDIEAYADCGETAGSTPLWTMLKSISFYLPESIKCEEQFIAPFFEKHQCSAALRIQAPDTLRLLWKKKAGGGREI